MSCSDRITYYETAETGLFLEHGNDNKKRSYLKKPVSYGLIFFDRNHVYHAQPQALQEW